MCGELDAFSSANQEDLQAQIKPEIRQVKCKIIS